MSAMTLSNATSVKPTVSVTEGGNFVFQLVVNNGCFYSAPSLVSVSNQYVLATANAGPNQRASVGGAVQLDGSRSTDQNDYSITYAWSLLSAPAGSTAALSSTSSVRPTFVPDQLGLYVFQLITEDGSALGYPIIPATTEVSTSELPPVAVPGAPRTVPVGTFVTLNGSASSSSNGQALTYSWSLISTPSGSSAALTSTTSATPSFTADVVGTYIAQLTVNDGFLNSTPESVEISTIDLPPIANAGPNQTVLVGSTVQLNGSGSLDFDNHALTYQWSTLSPMGGGVNSINENPTFTANTVGIYVCELIVNDGITNSLPSTVVITVYAANVPPTVSAGANQEIELPTNTATLNGSATSTGPPGSPVTVQWTQVSGPGTVTFANATQAVTQATFPVAGTFVLKLTGTVTATGLSNSAQTTVTVAPLNEPPVVTVGPDQTITYPVVSANLTGTATDDGYPPGSTLQISWSKVTGPGSVTFANAAQPNTQATFSVPGIYVLRLSASDGQYTSTATMKVTFIGPAGGPLTVSAGPNQVIVFPNPTTLAGSVSDPFLPVGGSVSTQWTAVSGPGTVTFGSTSSLTSSVSFSQQGVYDLRLSATDGVSSNTSDVQIYVGHITCTSSNNGTEFWLMFPGIQYGSPNFPTRDLEIDISSETATSGVLSVPGIPYSTPFTVTPGQIAPIYLPLSTMVISSDTVETKGIHITALNPVAVSGLNYFPAASDGFLGLPTTALGTSYVVAAALNTVDQSNGTEFAITATKDNTVVTIIPTASVSPRQRGVPYTVQLNTGQTYQLRDESDTGIFSDNAGPLPDFTGTVITANNPIAVFGGADCVNIPSYSDTCNGLVEQLPPTNLWGTDFVTMPFSSELNGDFFRVITNSPNTHVKLNGKLVATLDAGEFVDQLLTAPSVISTDAPVLLVQYAASQAFSGNGNTDPSMAVVPAFEQFGSNYTISAPATGFPTINYVNVVAPSTAVASGGIFLDGAALAAKGFTAIGTSGFSGAQVAIAAGTHTLTGSLPFGVMSYGFATADAYSFTAGVCYAQGPTGDTLTLTPATATNQITSQVTLTALVKDQFGNPIGGVGVTFQVTGANPTTATTTTNSSGIATFPYRGFHVGTDTVSATAGLAIGSAILTWIGNGTNQPPVVSAGPNQTVSLPTTSTILIGSVVDDGLPVGGHLTSLWTVSSGPSGATFSAPTQTTTQVTFTQAGTYVLELTGNDSALSTSATTTVIVYPPNKPPSAYAGPDQTAVFINGYQQTVTLSGTASDDGLPVGSTLKLQWTALSGPGLVTFAPATTATTTATFGAPGFYTVALSANDGQYITTAYAGITLAQPVLSIPASVVGTPSTAIPLVGTVALNGSPAGSLVSTNWILVSQPSGAQATIANTNAPSTTLTASVAGTYVVELCVLPQNLVCSGPETVAVVPTGTALPTVSFSTADGTEITKPTSITGSVSSGNWTLQYAPQNETTPQPYIPLASGSGTVNAGSLGTLDPSLLINGLYVLQLSTQDQYGQTASAIVHVNVSRNLKVGVLTLSFNDLTVPVAGVPIQVIRSYDSRDKGLGDFGIGWRLSLSNIHAQKTHSIGIGWNQVLQGSGLSQAFCLQVPNPAFVTVVFPDGRSYRFEESLSQSCSQIVSLAATTVTFVQLPGPANTAGASLVPIDGGAVLVDGDAPGASTLLGYDGNTYDPTVFILTTADGAKYTVDQTAGLTSVTDTNSNTLTIASTGITSSTGKSVNFTRDPQNRITNISDENGNLLKYTYDTSGNLASFVDRNGNGYAFTYGTNSPYNLVSIIGPDGNNAIANTYDSSGRLLSSANSFGQSSTFTHNIAAQVETVKDALGNSTTYSYDQDGNILQVTDPLGHVTSSTYDSSDNKLSDTNALGKTTTYTYDGLGNRLTTTDPLGHVTTYTYNALSKPLTIQDPNGHTTTNTYDANGNLLTTTDPLGNVTTNTYNTSGMVLTSKDPLGHISQFSYDAYGNLLTQTDANNTVTTYTVDPNGNRLTQSVTRSIAGGSQTLLTQYAYDATSRLIKTTYPDGAVTQVAYNTLGQQGSTTDAKGNVTTYAYDIGGHLTSTTYPDGTMDTATFDLDGHRITSQSRNGLTMGYTYDASGRLTQSKNTFSTGVTITAYDAAGQAISSTDPLNHVTQYAYDAAGRRTTVTDTLNHVTTFTYDNAGNQLTVFDANNNTTTYTYDNDNRQTRVTYPDGKFDSTAYDALGRIASRTDAKGLTTQYGYDALGRLITVTDALNQVTSYTYDQVGNRLTQTDANNHTTTYAYDQRGRRLQRTLPGNQTESYAYDPNGNLSSRTDFNGHTTTYAYDTLNELLSKTPDRFFNASPVTFTYTASGRASMTDPSGRTTYAYDTSDRLEVVNRPAGSLSYTYDVANNLTQIQGPGFNVNYTYDVLNRLSTAQEANTGTTSYTYDRVGNLSTVTYPDTVVHTYAYDTRNRLTNLGVNGSVSGAPGPIASYAYTLDGSGHRLTVAELSGRNVAYAYDNLYRLTSETIAADPHSINGAVTYVYDKVGNRTSKTSTLPGYPGGTLNYNSNDQLTTDTYDSDGNTTASNSLAYAYDFENHLVQQGGISVVYDGDGNRATKTVAGVTSTYLVDTQNPTGYVQVLQETFTGNTGANYESQHTYVYGLERISERRNYLSNNQSATANAYYIYDGHGSVRALANSTGAVTDTYDYDAFGNLLHSSTTLASPTPNNYLFAGEQFDPDLNLYYNRARYLNTSTGRFWSMDTFEGRSQDPLSLHKYLYAAGDPVGRRDPSGRDFADTLGAIAIDITLSAQTVLPYAVTVTFVAGVVYVSTGVAI
jgi:RHS repeat-associated protein